MDRGIKVGLLLAGAFAAILPGFYFAINQYGKEVLGETIARIAADAGPEGLRSHDEFVPREDENFYGASIFACLADYELDPDPNKDLWDRIEFAHPDEVTNLRQIVLPRLTPDPYDYFPRRIFSSEDSQSDGRGMEKELIVWAANFRLSNEYSVADTSISPSKQILGAIKFRYGSLLKEMGIAARRRHSFAHTLTLDDTVGWRGEASLTYQFADSLLKFLSLRLAAALDAGDSAVFRETWMICQRIIEGEMRNLNSTGLLLACTQFSTLTDSISLGIENDSLSRDDLDFYYRELTRIPFSKMVEGSFAEEITFYTATFESLKRHRNRTWELISGHRTSGAFRYLLGTAPGGWIDLNAASSIRWTYDEGVFPWRMLEFQSLRDIGARIPDSKSVEHLLAAHTLFPDPRFSKGLAQAHVKKELTQLACLLKMFEIDHGTYPERLEDLIPVYLSELPKDPFSGISMKYQKESNGYLLYSVGMNLSDDFGDVIRDRRGQIVIDSGDWVWGARNRMIPEEAIRREKAVFRIHLEQECGETITEEAFLDAWEGKLVGFEDSAEFTTEEARRQRLILKARVKLKQDTATPRP